MIGVMERPTAEKNPAYHLAPTALAVVLFYLPMTLPMAPAPIYYALTRHGRKYGLTAAVGAAVAVGIISGAVWALVFTAICVLTAVAAAEAYWRGASLGLSVASAAALPFVASLGLFLLIAQGAGAGAFKAIEDAANKSVDMLLEQRPQAVGDKVAVAELQANKETLVWLISAVFPGITLCVGIFLALTHYLFTRALSIKFGWAIHSQGHDLAAWRAPEKLALALAAGLALSLMGAPSAAAAIGLNLVIVTGMVYSLHGLSVVHYWLGKSGVPPAVNVMVLALMFLALLWAVVFLAILGLADTLMDFRRTGRRMGGPAA